LLAAAGVPAQQPEVVSRLPGGLKGEIIMLTASLPVMTAIGA
jgi:hypothetical protein